MVIKMAKKKELETIIEKMAHALPLTKREDKIVRQIIEWPELKKVTKTILISKKKKLRKLD